jgi:hypothetical protein
MTDPGLALQKSVGDVLVAASLSVVAGDAPPGQAFPYVRIGDDTLIPFHTKDVDGADATATVVAWGANPTSGKTTSSSALAALTNRASPLTLTGWRVLMVELDARLSMLVDRQDDETAYYGFPIRIRLTLQEL